jgi:hypothetical protein
LQDTLNVDSRQSSIRLREGEHQYSLAKAIASFELEFCFPDVKDLVRKLYGEEKTVDIQLIRKVQTILKKMEKSNIVKILSKRAPWELQRYALSSFRFQDLDRNLVVLASDEQIKQAQNLLNTLLSREQPTMVKWRSVRSRLYALMLSLLVIASYLAIVWDVLQPIVNWAIFISAFSVAIAGSIVLGRTLSRE